MVNTVTHIRTKWRFFLLVVGLGWLLSGQGYSTAQQTVTLEAYLSAIADYRSQILRAGNDAAQCTETMTAVADALRQLTAVQFPDGSVMHVSHEGAAQALQARPCNAARADRYLSGLCPNQLCTVSRPLPPLRPVTGGQSSGSLAGAAGAASDSSAMPAAASPDDLPPTTPLPAPIAEVDPAASQSGAAEGGETAATAEAQAAATVAPQTEVESVAQTKAGEGQTETVPEGQTDQADQGESVPGTEGTDEGAEGAEGEAGEVAQPTQTTNNAANVSSTPTAVPNSPAPTSAPLNSPEATGANNRWLLVAVIVVVALGLIGTAVALLLWQNNEEEVAEEEGKEVVTAVNEGRQLVETGDYREAVRRLFLAMMLALDEKGVLRFDRNRTNLELLQQERLHQSLIPSLTPIIATYERVWYGLEPLPPAEYEQLASKIKTIRDWRVET